MKYKVLFAKTGIAKFMALLVTLLAMFASCNFWGGEDARTPTVGSNDPGKFNGMFKSVIPGLGLQILAQDKGDGTYDVSAGIDSKGNIVVKKLGWWGCSYGAWDSDGAKLTGKYDVSNVAYVKFDLKADSEGIVRVKVFNDSGNSKDFNMEEVDDIEDGMGMAGIKDIKIDIANKKEYVSELVIFGSGAKPVHARGSKIRVENFTFYDENGREVVPSYIKYAEGEIPDNPGVGDGEGTTFAGVFKNPIPGQIDVGIWENSFTCDDLPEIIARNDAWWGGAFGWIETQPEWSMPRKYDISEIVKCSFDVTAVTDINGVYVTVFPAINYKGENNQTPDRNCEFAWEDKGDTQRKVDVNNLKAGDKKNYVIDFDVAYGKSTNRASLIGFGGNGAGCGGTLSITNITFYDRAGREVVPQIANGDGSGDDNQGDSDTTVTLDGVKYNYGGENGTWFGQQGAWEPTEQQPTVEQTSDGMKLTVKEKNGTEQWKGQIKLKSETPVVSGKKYDITVVVRSTQAFNDNVTYKPQLMSKTNENDDYAFEVREKQTVHANQDETVEFKGKSVDRDGTFQMTFDFPGCEVGTEILIKSLTFKESADQTKDDFVVGGDIQANGAGGALNFPYMDVDGASEYHLYVGNSATPARVFRSDIDGGQNRIEIKPAFKKNSNLLSYPYCRKVGELFPDGAGEYKIKVVPVIDDEEDESKAMTSKYTLMESNTGWMPKIEGVFLTPILENTETNGKLKGITFAYTNNSEIDSFNVFVKKKDVLRDVSANKWGGSDQDLSVKDSGDILSNVNNLEAVFKSGAGIYEIYFEPVKSDGTIGTNIAIKELDVSESMLK